MPITQERQTIQDMRAAGFSEEQALLLVAKFEATAQATSQDLKTFISAENERLRAEVRSEIAGLRADMGVRFAQLEARFERSLRIVLVALVSTFVGVTGLGVAVIKLLP